MPLARGPEIERAAAALRGAAAVAVIGGAGLSAESGVPTFRGPGGLWRNYRPEDLATPAAFLRNPVLVWEWYWWRRKRIAQSQPNAGHRALACLEDRFPSFIVLTQNVDGLHRDAGSRNIIELHGNIWRARCSREPGVIVDQRHEAIPEVGPDTHTEISALPRCSCRALMRPDVVWFGELLDQAALDAAAAAVRACDVLLVVGTSAVVHPVAALPRMVRRGQATVVEINIDETPLTAEADVVLRGPSGEVLPELEKLL